MKKVKVKIPAKINLSFDIIGKEEKFHKIRSLVASCNIYDAVTLYARKDKSVTLKEIGIKAGCPFEENNAVKAAKAFINTFGTCGVDIIINKKIPVGGGLGGSSADIAAVLKGMCALYNEKANIYPLAQRLGSDVTYMLNGGYAVISGKGDDVERLAVEQKLHLLVIFGENAVSAGQVYAEFDKSGVKTENSTENCVKRLLSGDIEGLSDEMKNDLYLPSLKFCPEMADAIKDLEEAGAYKGVMTGSGSTVFGIFNDKNSAKSALKKIKKKFGKKVKYVTTIVCSK